jgi:hypothetical protein
VTEVVEESPGAAVDRGGGGVGRGVDRIATCRPRPAEGGGRCRGRGGAPHCSSRAVAGARRAWGGGQRGRMGRTPVGVWAAVSVRRVCGSGEDDVGGRVREDSGRVRAEARVWRAGRGRGTSTDAWVMAAWISVE